MPHLILEGGPDWDRLAKQLLPEVVRWGRAVLKTSSVWTRADGGAALVEGVVVEFSRPLLPVALVAPHHENTAVRLWPAVPVERTRAVQRWLALLAARVRHFGAGPLVSTNLPEDLWKDLGLSSPQPRVPA